MKTFLINIDFNVYKDSYTEGETKHVNGWSYSTKTEAETPREAIKKAFNELCYSFEIENAYIYHEEDSESEINTLHYSNMVDIENSEVKPDSKIYKEWKEGKAELFSCNSFVEVFEVVKTKI